MKFFMPIILIAISGTFFFLVTNPMYNSIAVIKAQADDYNNALSTSKTLENERETLTTKYNSIDPNNLAKLQKLLPDSVNNIRLILEIEQIAAPYNMTLSSIQYDTTDDSTTASVKGSADSMPTAQGASAAIAAQKDYGTFDLEFSTSGTYDNFVNFTKDLENNLRIVDISSITFSSDTPASTGSGLAVKAGSPDAYTYNFKIKTYWLKN